MMRAVVVALAMLPPVMASAAEIKLMCPAPMRTSVVELVAPEKCTGCRLCELVCSVFHDGVSNANRSRIKVMKWESEGRYIPMSCQQCQDAPCMIICPVKAISRDEKLSRVMVNQPQAASNSGNLWNGMRQTFSLGCGSWGGNSTNNNITWRDLINETWVSKPLVSTKQLPTDEELFGRDIIEALS